MRIKTNIQPTPAANTAKSVIRFAWLPHRIEDKIMWLERYEVLYVREERELIASIAGNPMKFIIANWTKVSERAI